MCIGLMLAASRRLSAVERHLQGGVWKKWGPGGPPDLGGRTCCFNSTALVVGYGEVGKRVSLITHLAAHECNQVNTNYDALGVIAIIK
eukprot:SAG31_NODE_212_length_20157_cov_9.648868_24_plen_88_part_00